MIVDVIIPCYNGEKYLRRAIESVNNQSFKVNKIIVVNDGSLDNSEVLLQELSQSIHNLIIISRTHQGLSSARNSGISASQADLIALLDVDDYWLPDKLRRQIEYLQNNPKKLAVFSSFLESREGNLTEGKDAPAWVRVTPRSILLQLTFFPGSGSSILFRSSLYTALNGQLFDPDLFFAEDLDCWVRILLLGGVGVIKSRDVVIDVRAESMQGKSTRYPMPYLRNLLTILYNHRGLISNVEYYFHRYFVIYQGCKFDFSIKLTRSDLSQISRYFPLMGRLQNDFLLRLISIILMPAYWIYRKLITNK